MSRSPARTKARSRRSEPRGETRATGHVLERFSAWLRTAGQSERSERANDEAIDLLEPLGKTWELAAAYADKAGNSMLVGRVDEWERWTERALELAEELGLPRIQQRTMQYRGLIRMFHGDVDGLDDVAEAVRLGSEQGLGQETASAYINLADWTCRTRDAAAGLDIYGRGIAFAEAHGLGSMAMWPRAERTWPLFDLGRWDDAVEEAEQVRRWFPGRGKGTQFVMAMNQQIHVFAWRGEVERAAELITDALPAARRIGDIQVIRPALTAAARLAALRGDAAAARALLDELADELDRAAGYSRSYGMLDGVLVAVGIGDVVLAERLAEGSNVRFPQGRLVVSTSGALVAEARGRHADALAEFADAAEGWSDLGHVFQEAIARLGAARCLSALGRHGDAAAQASRAARTFDMVRAPRAVGRGAWADRTDHAGRRLNPLGRRRRSAEPCRSARTERGR